MKTIYLFRHGQTFANENNLYCGQRDISLSPKGIREINIFSENNFYPKANLYVSSGLKRANKTLEIIIGKSHYLSLFDLKEYNFGDFEMKSYEELKDDPKYLSWINDTSGNICCYNGGESRIQFKKRVTRGIDTLKSYFKNPTINSIFVVCHGGVIGTLLEELFPFEKSFYEWQPKSGRGYKIFFEENNNNYNVKKYEELRFFNYET